MKKSNLKFLVCLFSLFLFSYSYGQISGWKYIRKIQINNVGGSALSNYQIPVVIDANSLIMAGKMKSDASDIRFTDSSGTVFYPYWLETSANNTQAKFWVKVPSIPAAGIYSFNMVYGNATATAMSNGDDVFELFDDFSQTTLNKNKWTIREARNYPVYHSINNGMIRVYGEKQTFNPGAFLISKKSTDLTDKILETSMATYDNGVKSQYIALYPDTNFYPAGGQFLLASRPGYTNAFTNNQLGVNGNWITSGTKYPLPMEFNNSSLIVTSNKISSIFKGETITLTQMPTSTNGHLYFGAADDYSSINGGLLIDYLFLRSYTEIEPQPTVGIESFITSIIETNNIATVLQVYPNPVNDKLVVILENNNFKADNFLQISNCLGQVMLKQQIISGNKNIEISTGSLPSGIYILSLGQQRFKIVKE